MRWTVSPREGLHPRRGNQRSRQNFAGNHCTRYMDSVLHESSGNVLEGNLRVEPRQENLSVNQSFRCKYVGLVYPHWKKQGSKPIPLPHHYRCYNLPPHRGRHLRDQTARRPALVHVPPLQAILVPPKILRLYQTIFLSCYPLFFL